MENPSIRSPKKLSTRDLAANDIAQPTRVIHEITTFSGFSTTVSPRISIKKDSHCLMVMLRGSMCSTCRHDSVRSVAARRFYTYDYQSHASPSFPSNLPRILQDPLPTTLGLDSTEGLSVGTICTDKHRFKRCLLLVGSQSSLLSTKRTRVGHGPIGHAAGGVP